MPIERNYQEYPVESPPGRRVNYWLPDRKDFQMRQYHCTCGSKFCAMLNGPAYTETTMVHSVDLLKAELQDESQWKTLFDPEGYSKNCEKYLWDLRTAIWDLKALELERFRKVYAVVPVETRAWYLSVQVLEMLDKSDAEGNFFDRDGAPELGNNAAKHLFKGFQEYFGTEQRAFLADKSEEYYSTNRMAMIEQIRQVAQVTVTEGLGAWQDGYERDDPSWFKLDFLTKMDKGKPCWEKPYMTADSEARTDNTDACIATILEDQQWLGENMGKYLQGTREEDLSEKLFQSNFVLPSPWYIACKFGWAWNFFQHFAPGLVKSESFRFSGPGSNQFERGLAVLHPVCIRQLLDPDTAKPWPVKEHLTNRVMANDRLLNLWFAAEAKTYRFKDPYTPVPADDYQFIRQHIYNLNDDEEIALRGMRWFHFDMFDATSSRCKHKYRLMENPVPIPDGSRVKAVPMSKRPRAIRQLMSWDGLPYKFTNPAILESWIGAPPLVAMLKGGLTEQRVQNIKLLLGLYEDHRIEHREMRYGDLLCELSELPSVYRSPPHDDMTRLHSDRVHMPPPQPVGARSWQELQMEVLDALTPLLRRIHWIYQADALTHSIRHGQVDFVERLLSQRPHHVFSSNGAEGMRYWQIMQDQYDVHCTNVDVYEVMQKYEPTLLKWMRSATGDGDSLRRTNLASGLFDKHTYLA